MATTTRPTAAAATTTTNTSSLRHRRPVWSHNTSCTGAAGVHSEVSSKAQAMSLTSQRQLSSNLSTIQSIHRKELRSLNHHRRSLETSMLAYTEKMRRISMERLMLTAASESSFDTASIGACSDRSSVSEASESRNGGSTALERLLSLNSNKAGSQQFGSSSRFFPPEAAKKRQSRVSVDSGVDVTMGGYEDDLRRSSDSLQHKKQQRPVPDIKVTCEPTTGDRCEDPERNPNPGEHTPTPQGRSRQNRQRRPGTAEKPDLLALQQADSHRSGSSPSSSDSISSCDTTSEVSLAITAFPEFTFSSSASSSLFSEARADDPGVFTPASGPSTDRSQSTSSTTSQKSPRKKLSAAKARREDYWNYRKPSTRHSISIASSSPRKLSPRQTDNSSPLKPSSTKQKHGNPAPVKKTFQRSFRYSNAVEDVIKSIDVDSDNNIKHENDTVTGFTAAKVSEILPTLDIEDLRQDTRRLRKEETYIIKTSAEAQESQSPEDTEDGSESSLGVDTAVTRERSMSAPEVLGDQQKAAVIKPLLKKYDSASNLSSAQPRKTVHFRLPEEES